MTYLERFWTKVDKRGPEECWEWTACRTKDGYGQLGLNGTSQLAHRFAFVQANPGLQITGFCICHRCDNPRCVNPAHLFRGTPADNVRDMESKGRQRRSPGTRNGFSKLTDEKVRAIRRDPRLQQVIALDYDVSKSLIGVVKSRKAWKHVD